MLRMESNLVGGTVRENRIELECVFVCVSVFFLICINIKDYYLFTTSSWTILQLEFKLNARLDTVQLLCLHSMLCIESHTITCINTLHILLKNQQ